MGALNLVPIIEKKKCRQRLSDSEIQFWIESLVAGQIPDYQSAALLMAIRLNGMDFDETAALTRAMADSGDRLSFPDYPVLVDKHSTGGIGDKVTIILAPILAACGLPVTMLSGRGLGFSGGTIDKFESLTGVSCNVSGARMRAMLDRCGWANAQASDRIAPADRVLYGLRDVTATVDSIPLITASILSKKIAGGAGYLTMDVKCGASAFMQDEAMARELAENLRTIGGLGGLSVRGVISRMEEPLGRAVGNYLELLESVTYLRVPPDEPLMELVLVLGEIMLEQGGITDNCRERMLQKLADGTALQRLVDYLRFSGAEEAALEGLLADSFANHPRFPLLADRSGVVTAIAGRQVGFLLVDWGAGRRVVTDRLDPLAGVVLEKQVGERVEAGDVLAWIYGTRPHSDPEDAKNKLRACFSLGESGGSESRPIILHSF